MPSAPAFRTRNLFEKSSPPVTKPIGGIRISFTSDVTILPNAAPMMTPTARSMALPLTANSLNSFHMWLISSDDDDVDQLFWNDNHAVHCVVGDSIWDPPELAVVFVLRFADYNVGDFVWHGNHRYIRHQRIADDLFHPRTSLCCFFDFLSRGVHGHLDSIAQLSVY